MIPTFRVCTLIASGTKHPADRTCAFNKSVWQEPFTFWTEELFTSRFEDISILVDSLIEFLTELHMCWIVGYGVVIKVDIPLLKQLQVFVVIF